MKAGQKISKSEKTREMIIEKASKVFNKNGFAGTSVRHLSKATLRTSGSIYFGFKGKKDLASEAFDYNAAKLEAGYRKYISQFENPLDQLYSLLDYPAKELPLVFQSGCPLLNMSTEADDTLPWMMQKVKESLRKIKLIFEQVIRDGIQKSIFNDVDPEKFTNFLFACIEGSIMLAKSEDKISLIKDNSEMLKLLVKNELVKK